MDIFRYHRYFYGYLYPRIVNNNDNFLDIQVFLEISKEEVLILAKQIYLGLDLKIIGFFSNLGEVERVGEQGMI